MEDIENRNLKILLISLAVIGLFYLLLNIISPKKEIKDNKHNEEKIELVADYNKFFIVSSCARRYLNYVSNIETENIIELLSNDYKKNNSITENNLYNLIGTLPKSIQFSARKMYYHKINNYTTKYYVHGTLREVDMEILKEKKDYYIIVILDEKNMTFAIEPYDGKIFKN